MDAPQRSLGNANESGVQKSRKWSPTILAACITAFATLVAALLSVSWTHHSSKPLSANFSGEVHDSAGQPIPRARVSVTQDEATPEVVFSDDGGVFHVKLRSGVNTVRVTVLAKGFVPLTRDVEPERSGPEELVLERMPAASTTPAAQPLPRARIETHGRDSPVVIGNSNDVKIGPK